MQVEAKLTYGKIRFDQETDAHLVVTVTAPEATNEAKRPPLCIIPLIDVSPSMEGAKLLYAKRSLIKLIDHLSANDYCGLIAFSYSAQTLSRPIKCTPEAKEELKRKVQGLTLSGATNIADALLEGFRVANNMDLPSEVITRVILFTDGAANTGPAKTPPDILALVKPNIGIATVSAFGYGVDAIQDFLSDLSKTGNGNYSFVQNPDDALTAFGKELGGLLSTYATNLLIKINPLAGHEITQVVTDVDAEEEDTGQVKLKVADILAGETRNFVLAVKLHAQKAAFPREVNVFNIQAGYDTLDANLRREHSTLETTAKVQFVKQGEHQDKPAPELDQIVGLAQVVRAQLEAEEYAKRGDYKGAQSVMSTVSSNVNTRGLVGLGNVATNIGGRMRSRATYADSQAYLTSVTRGATRGYSGTYDVSAAQDLQSLGVNLTNASQATVSATFTRPDDQAAGAVDLRLDRPSIADALRQFPGLDLQVGGVHLPQGNTWVSSTPPTVNTWSSTNLPMFNTSSFVAIAPDPTVPTVPATPAEKPKAKKRKISQKSKRW
jgi:Ca-activated chloride channel family protein